MTAVVIGLGKLGYPLARILAHAGHDVWGVDVDASRVARLIEGRTQRHPADEPGLYDLGGRCTLGTPDAVAGALDGIPVDVYVILVPTPSREDGSFDDTSVLEAAQWIADRAAPGSTPMVVVSSTVMPGTTTKVGLFLAERGVAAAMVYSPEFIALGAVVTGMQNPDMVLIGALNPETCERYVDFMAPVLARPVPWVRLGIAEAEVAKLAVNAYVTMRLSFANTLLAAARAASTPRDPVDAYAVAEAIGHDSRIGGRYLQPGAPYGGPCFERDQAAYQRIAQTFHLRQFCEGANRVALDEIVGACQQRGLHSATSVAVLGLAYRPGTPVTDGALGLKLIGALAPICEHYDIRLMAFDPLARPRLPRTVEFTPAAVTDAELTILAMPWNNIARALPRPGPRHQYIDPWRVLVPDARYVESIGSHHGARSDG